MIKIGLDLAFRTVGIAILDTETNALEYTSHRIKQGIEILDTQFEMINFIFEYIQEHLSSSHVLIIEKVFYGKDFESVKNTAMTQGGVVDRYRCLMGQTPRFFMATTVRNNVGLTAWASKAEIQRFVIDRFKLGTISADTLKELSESIEKYNLEYKRLMHRKKTVKAGGLKRKINKELLTLKREHNNHLTRISTKIKKETNIDEHIADAIVLAMGG